MFIKKGTLILDGIRDDSRLYLSRISREKDLWDCFRVGNILVMVVSVLTSNAKKSIYNNSLLTFTTLTIWECPKFQKTFHHQSFLFKEMSDMLLPREIVQSSENLVIKTSLPWLDY
jgi:hypothetical protein